MASRKTKQKPIQMIPSDDDWNSSCCDYRSDVFKEQLSVDQFSNIDNDLFMDQTNFLQSPDSLPSHTVSNNRGSGQQHSIRQQIVLVKKNQHDQNHRGSVSSHNTLSNNNQSQVTFNQRHSSSNGGSGKHQRKPLFSHIPNKIHKNAENLTSRETESQSHKQQYEMINGKQNNKNGNMMIFSEESEKIGRIQKNKSNNLLVGTTSSSYTNLTPVKTLPIPMSPTQRPEVSYNSATVNNSNTARNMQQSQPQLLQKQDSNTCGRGSSGQKTTVVYNEFKYFTSGSNAQVLIQAQPSSMRKSESSGYELSPNQHQIFELVSPKNRATTKSDQQQSSVKKQAFTFGGNYNSIDQQRNYTLTSKQDSFTIQDQINEMRNKIQEQEYQLKEKDSLLRSVQNPQIEEVYEQKMQQLQDQIEQLEFDLKSSMEKNMEMKKQIKDKSFLQGFDRNNSRLEKGSSLKHLTDTEDSLILSEKKQRNSLSKQTLGGSKSSSSIVDVKIKQIANLKCGPSYSPKDDSFDQDYENQVQYQVDNHQDMPSEQNIEELQDEEDCENQECESCERLKQLVFQAKEAIDDLKQEIEEWREISAEKETELRQLNHRLHNDLIGVDKNVIFEDTVHTKEFDSARPVATDGKRVKNFIKHNKKRIRSRSKNLQDSAKKGQSDSTMYKKKSALKKYAEYFLDQEREFYEAEDQGVQTSMVFENQESSLNAYKFSNNKLTITSTNQCITQTNTQCSPKDDDLKENTNPLELTNKDESSHQLQLLSQQDIIESLKSKTLLQDSEVVKLRQVIQVLTKKCDSFFSIVNKVKRTQKNKQQPQFELQEIQQNFQLVSPLESYSILEKINEWKKEEGLESAQLQLPECQIPRPLKLLSEIDIEEMQQLSSQKQVVTSIDPNAQSNEYFKNEQMQLKKQQEQKYKELQRFQQEYLQQLTN